MTHAFVHAIGLVFYFFLLWLFLQMAHASWGTRWAAPKWVAMVNTPFMRAIRIKWLSVILVVAVAAQIALVIFMLGVSAWTGRPITFD